DRTVAVDGGVVGLDRLLKLDLVGGAVGRHAAAVVGLRGAAAAAAAVERATATGLVNRRRLTGSRLGKGAVGRGRLSVRTGGVGPARLQGLGRHPAGWISVGTSIPPIGILIGAEAATASQQQSEDRQPAAAHRGQQRSESG